MCLTTPRDAVSGVQRLIRIGLARRISIRRHLTAADIDSLETGGHHLHRLQACQRTQSCDVWLTLEKLPQAVCAAARECIFDRDGSPQTFYLSC
jgi:hypothetical protein